MDAVTRLVLSNAVCHDSFPVAIMWGADNEREYTGSTGKRTLEGQHIGYADQLAEDIPRCTKRYMEGAGHNVMFDRPRAYREGLAAFLA